MSEYSGSAQQKYEERFPEEAERFQKGSSTQHPLASRIASLHCNLEKCEKAIATLEESLTPVLKSGPENKRNLGDTEIAESPLASGFVELNGHTIQVLDRLMELTHRIDL